MALAHGQSPHELPGRHVHPNNQIGNFFCREYFPDLYIIKETSQGECIITISLTNLDLLIILIHEKINPFPLPTNHLKFTRHTITHHGGGQRTYKIIFLDHIILPHYDHPQSLHLLVFPFRPRIFLYTTSHGLCHIGQRHTDIKVHQNLFPGILLRIPATSPYQQGCRQPKYDNTSNLFHS